MVFALIHEDVLLLDRTLYSNHLCIFISIDIFPAKFSEIAILSN